MTDFPSPGLYVGGQLGKHSIWIAYGHGENHGLGRSLSLAAGDRVRFGWPSAFEPSAPWSSLVLDALSPGDSVLRRQRRPGLGTAAPAARACWTNANASAGTMHAIRLLMARGPALVLSQRRLCSLKETPQRPRQQGESGRPDAFGPYVTLTQRLVCALWRVPDGMDILLWLFGSSFACTCFLTLLNTYPIVEREVAEREKEREQHCLGNDLLRVVSRPRCAVCHGGDSAKKNTLF
jgi:hypothetical protein